MLALYREGRQADALDAYRDASTLLRDELGLEPGRSLRELQHAILTHDPSLDVERPALEPSGGVPVCPFKGLASFEPSGIGKSCVLRAGLLRALASGALPGSENWQSFVVRPGAYPADELGRIAPARAARERSSPSTSSRSCSPFATTSGNAVRSSTPSSTQHDAHDSTHALARSRLAAGAANDAPGD
jgi:Bacterial transcriptional activator domain